MNGNVNASESPKSSHFFLNTSLENLFILEFQQRDVEEVHYDDDFLQENVVEMSIAKVSFNEEYCIKTLLPSIKARIDEILSVDDAVVSITVFSNQLKHNLISRCLETTTDPNLQFLEYEVNEITFFFLFNEEKTSTIQLYNSLGNYFYKNYQIDWTPK